MLDDLNDSGLDEGALGPSFLPSDDLPDELPTVDSEPLGEPDGLADLPADTPGIGHNTGPAINDDTSETNDNPFEVSGLERLEGFIQRIENLEDEKANLMADIREIFAEAKAQGYDVKTMRQILKLRKMDQDDRDEMETLLEVYKRALGMN